MTQRALMDTVLPRVWRTGMTRWAAAMMVATTLLSSVAEAGPRSGLAWDSGGACADPSFESWRGRPLDVHIGYAPWNTWSNMLAWIKKGNPARLGKPGHKVSIGLGLLTRESEGRFRECAAGAFDKHFKEVGSSLVAQGKGDIHLRLGWEANGSTSFPWYMGNDITTYRLCFQRAVTALRSTAPAVKIDWHMAKKGKLPVSVAEAYPGDAFVDHVAVSYYDRFAFNTTQAIWDTQFNRLHNGGPWGIGAWLAFAKSHGKPFSVPEWAVNDGYQPDGTDNALFVRNMGAFFKANAAHIGYEGYFNCPHADAGMYSIHPSKNNPAAAAAYFATWGRAGAPAQRGKQVQAVAAAGG